MPRARTIAKTRLLAWAPARAERRLTDFADMLVLGASRDCEAAIADIGAHGIFVTVARRRRWHEKIGLFVLRREKPPWTRAPNALAVRGDGEALAGTKIGSLN
jgi:hypothetical protein